GGRDDLINAAAIALVGVLKPLSGAEGWIEHYRRLSEKPPPGLGSDRVRVQVPAKLELSTIYGISGNAYCVEVGSDGRRTVIMPLDDAKALVFSPTSSAWRDINPISEPTME